jgi:DNA-directed RNA polymerase subunit D
MRIKILSKSDTELSFLLEDSNPQFANALRRIMISEIPVLAIRSIDFTINDSVLYDEVIASRMGLMPLVFKLGNFNFKDLCKCKEKGCSQCEVVFAIKKKGPGTVYAKDMKSSNPDVKPLYDDTPIVELGEDQTLKLQAVASLGFGKEHARHQAANVSYRYYPLVKVNGKIKNEQDCVKVCPKHALKLGGKASVSLDCDLCMECVKTANPSNLEISGDNTKFIFNVESISGLAVNEIVLEAVDILKNKAKEFEKQVKKLK